MEDFMQNAEVDVRLNRELRKFNWGAFGFSWIWCLFNGVYEKARPIFVVFALWLLFGSFIRISFLEAILAVILFVMSVMCGVQGNLLAWESDCKNWKNLEEFIKVQKKWAAALAIIVIIAVVSWGLLVGSLLFFGSKVVTSRGAIIFESMIKDIVSSEKYSSFENGADVAAYLLAKENAPAKDGETLSGEVIPYGTTGIKFKYVSKKGTPYNLVYTFYKEKNCNLGKKNCYIYYYDDVASGEELVPIAKAYYDDKGKSKVVTLKSKKK